MDLKDVNSVIVNKSGHKKSPSLWSVLARSFPRLHSKNNFAFRVKALEDHFTDPAKEKRLIAALSVEQKSSYFLLKEWWEGRTSNVEFSRRAMMSLESEHDERKNTYFGVLANLCETELSEERKKWKWPKSSAAAAKQSLWEVRQRAALLASYQRIALDTASLTNSTFASPPRNAKPPFNATVDPGFWIHDPKDEHEQYPFYLWDTQQRVTVETSVLKSRLGKMPEYIAICHTWGNHISKLQDSISVPGTLWRIPFVDNCDIMELPSLLSRLPSRYIWIDWFCIPQVVDPKDKIRQSRKEFEIKKQPAGLRRAKTVLAWFNDIERWSIMPDVINYFGLRILQADETLNSGNAESIQAAITQLRERLDSTSELIAWSDISGDTIIPNEFFLSQWVLQECCVRPDMLMADAKLRVLKTAAGSGVHIDDVAAIARAEILPDPGQTQLPQAVKETLLVFRNSGVYHLPATQGLAVLEPEGWPGARLTPQENPIQLQPAPPDPDSSRGA